MPPRTTAVGVKSLLLLSFLLPVIGALQQQPKHNAYPPQASSDELSEKAASSARHWQLAAADSLQTRLSGQRGFRDTHVDGEQQRTRSSSNERALATLSPAGSHPAVRAPPAPKATTTGGITRQTARSLQDWQVEDILLLATVDGKIHARDRRTGARKWELVSDRAMVETVYHKHNKSLDENSLDPEDPLWIVEPSQDGAIYVYAPGSGFGIQRLGFTVKELVEQSPYSGEGYPAVAYTAEKKTTLYTVDASSGNITMMYSPGGAIVNEDRSCRKINPLESLDDEACEPIGTLKLGRTEYTIGVQDRDTGEQISTIRYFEWVPNNHDLDLSRQYTKPLDSKYVYTKHDGTIFGLDLASNNDNKAVSANKPIYRQKLSSPIAQVFDIVRRQGDTSGEASLVALPQPIAPSPSDAKDTRDSTYEQIFVNCSTDGSWYALSESRYPTVTDGAPIAPIAQGYGDPLLSLPSLSWPMSKHQQENFAGVHQLSPLSNPQHGNRIDAPEHPRLDPPLHERRKDLAETRASPWDNIPHVHILLTSVILGLITCVLVYRRRIQLFGKRVETKAIEQPAVAIQGELKHEQGQMPMVRESEPAQEIIFPHDGTSDEKGPEAVAAEDGFVQVDGDEPEEPKDSNEAKPKKKATRGKRGGKKQKEKEQQSAEGRTKRSNSESAEQVITVAASESNQVSGPLQINSLLIHTDKVIGQGSCGTSVFEGSFEGRHVAVKRMLSQYYELASQEVSFLQQSDDHPNVIRYFCQQKDDHFLYIAVELCQASLFEVWEAEKAKFDEDRQMQLRPLKHSIQQDVPKALQQLAAGLYHLHNLRIIHRDIKPQNILVAFPKRGQNNGPRLVISDFGLGKNLPENVSTLVDPTGNAGTSGWKAPELISQPKEDSKHSQSNSHPGGSENASGPTSGVKRAADIFSLGCLFFWVLTDGIHPYEDENGWQQLRELNIKRDNKKMGVLERWSDAYEPMQLISWMLEHQPENRPTALQVLNHPFFWPAEKRLQFLCDCSDHFEREQRGVFDDGYAGDSWDLRLLEHHAAEVIDGDFLLKLDRHFVDTLGKQRKYSGNRLLDLLRALRNKKNHYEDMPEDVKKRVGPLADGYLSFWCNRFPRLLMACYDVVHEAELQNCDRFKGYFALGKA